MSDDEPRIVERDGNVVRIVAGPMEAIAAIHRIGDTLILDRFSMDGAGPGSAGAATLLRLARQFGKDHGVATLRIRGTVRTTGANPGKLPREIVIHI